MKKFKPYFQISTLVAGNRKKVNLINVYAGRHYLLKSQIEWISFSFYFSF